MFKRLAPVSENLHFFFVFFLYSNPVLDSETHSPDQYAAVCWFWALSEQMHFSDCEDLKVIHDEARRLKIKAIAAPQEEKIPMVHNGGA